VSPHWDDISAEANMEFWMYMVVAAAIGAGVVWLAMRKA
jgi:hypothetical protein